MISNRSIWLINKTLKGATTLSQSEPGSNGGKMTLHTPKLKTGVSLSDAVQCQVGRGYSSAEDAVKIFLTSPTGQAIINET